MKVSIVTVVLNNEKTIERAILSVLNQDYYNIEYILIDGVSTDETLKIIGKYRERISVLLSEKDQGIYDAMNKGIKNSSGEIVYFLNADDEFYDKHVISDVAKQIEANKDADYFYGGVVSRNMFGGKSENIRMKRISNNAIKFGRNIPHQALFVRRYLFEKLGLFDLTYKVNADYEWECRLVKKDYKDLFIERIISYYNQTGFSSRISWNPYKERFKIIYHHFGVFPLFYFFCYSLCKYSLVLLLSKFNLLKFTSKVINKIKSF